MKKTFVTSVFIFTTFFGAHIDAQNSEKFTGSLLWRVSGNGLEQPSYILGTHHMTGIDILTSVNCFEEAYNSCTQIIGEVDMNDPSIQTKTMGYAMMPEGYSYREILSEEDYDLLDSALKDFAGMGMAQLEGLHPAFLSSYYTVSMFASLEPGFDITKFVPVDNYIQNMAVRDGKSVAGLETIDFQLNVLYNSESIESMIGQLVCMVRNREYGIESLRSMNERYAAGDLYGLFELTNDQNSPCPMSPSFLDVLLDSRNETWLQKLPGMFAAEPTFVAVGALHLAGESGILAGLERLGYTVEAVK